MDISSSSCTWNKWRICEHLLVRMRWNCANQGVGVDDILFSCIRIYIVWYTVHSIRNRKDALRLHIVHTNTHTQRTNTSSRHICTNVADQNFCLNNNTHSASKQLNCVCAVLCYAVLYSALLANLYNVSHFCCVYIPFIRSILIQVKVQAKRWGGDGMAMVWSNETNESREIDKTFTLNSRMYT